MSLVPEGDDPQAVVTLWKARATPTTKGDGMSTTLHDAIDSLRLLRERTEALNAETKARADAMLDATGKGRLSKADDAARALRAAVEKYIDRHPTDARGRDITPEMALAAVSRTREGRRLVEAVRAEGTAGDAALRKAFALDPPNEHTPTPTRAERELEAVAKALARSSGRPWQAELAALVREPQGRELVEKHDAEAARR